MVIKMDVQQHNSIINFIKNFNGLSQECMKKIVGQYPHISYDTLFSIVSLENLKQIKLNHSKTYMDRGKYLEMYLRALEHRESPGVMLRIAEHFKVSPCQVAKLILSQYLTKIKPINHEKYLTSNLNIYLRDSTLIDDMDLSYEVFLCKLYDNIYSPLSEAMKGSLGQQYEVKLHNKVKELGLGFRDEEHLRKHGYDKTPDCKLDVPIAVDGFIVNWIESKALFGDPEFHKDYVKNQYVRYWNRFGSGLVIYWFGYLDTIVESNDKRFIIRDHFPENIIQLSKPNFDISF